MNNGSDLTPARLLEGFRRAPADVSAGRRALDDFSAVEDKAAFLEPTIQFLEQEKEDRIRSWGTNVLELIGGERAFRWLIGLFREKDTKDAKRTYLYTRFFALRAIARLAESDDEQKELRALLERIWPDDDEDYLTRAEAAILLAQQGRSEPEAWLQEMLRMYQEFWPIIRTSRALREFPLPSVADELCLVIRNSQYIDHKFSAIRALGAFKNDLNVVRTLGDVLVTDPDDYFRLMAIGALAELKDSAAQADIVRALEDKNAEVRLQAAKALSSILSPEHAVPIIVQQALKARIQDRELTYLVEALRQVDKDRSIATEILSKESGSEDRERAKVAEGILIELGGWAAVQRLSQRRITLDTLDKLLSESEEVVKSTYKDTIRQALYNFYFAMGVNVLVVFVGLALVVLAITHLVQTPEKLESWIIPGGTGLIGVIINLGFNNPRRNAREDLAALINVNVIFLGFLRALNEIDATFKHIYLEGRDFGVPNMRDTVQQIEKAVAGTLDMAARHLRGLKKPSEGKGGKGG